jgi:NAD(P)-dependent dehydrogenase (short-subunit alcohol dehydrogenase family)
MGRVQGKSCIITGGASGIGAATARLFAREGAKVLVTDVSEAAGEALAQSIRATGADAAFLRHDVTSEAEWQAAFALCLRRFGRVDALINNAGIGEGGRPEDETLESWRRMMSINLDGVFLGTKQALIAMKQQQPRGGAIVNLSSIYGIVGDPTGGAYNAAKGGVRLYTKSVALYAAKKGLGIRVNSVHPGYIWTPMVEAIARKGNDAEKAMQELVALHPIGRLGEPDDVAYGILYLASDEAKFVTGTELVIDGGYTAQ